MKYSNYILQPVGTYIHTEMCYRNWDKDREREIKMSGTCKICRAETARSPSDRGIFFYLRERQPCSIQAVIGLDENFPRYRGQPT